MFWTFKVRRKYKIRAFLDLWKIWAFDDYVNKFWIKFETVSHRGISWGSARRECKCWDDRRTRPKNAPSGRGSHSLHLSSEFFDIKIISPIDKSWRFREFGIGFFLFLAWSKNPGNPEIPGIGIEICKSRKVPSEKSRKYRGTGSGFEDLKKSRLHNPENAKIPGIGIWIWKFQNSQDGDLFWVSRFLFPRF